jgi:DNA-binding MarR family transcriptional regulator
MPNLLTKLEGIKVPPDDTFKSWIYFVKSYKAVIDRCDDEIRKSNGVTLAEFELLYILAAGGGRVRFLELSKATLLSQSRVSRQIDTLKAKGFVEREITDSNRRATYAVLTQAGLDKVNSAHLEFVRLTRLYFYDKIDADKATTFGEVLEAIMADPGYFERRAQIVYTALAENDKSTAKSSVERPRKAKMAAAKA